MRPLLVATWAVSRVRTPDEVAVTKAVAASSHERTIEDLSLNADTRILTPHGFAPGLLLRPAVAS